MIIGYSSPAPSPQHGFGLIIGGSSESYIMVYGEANSFGSDSPFDEALRSLRYLREDRKQIETVNISRTTLGRLNAVRTTVTYSCPGSGEKYVVISTLAISPNQAWVYEVALYSRSDKTEQDRNVLNELLKSWKYVGR